MMAGESNNSNRVTTVILLQKIGKHVAHYHDPDEGSPNASIYAKDLYMPHAAFEELGRPDAITLTIEAGNQLARTPKRKTAQRRAAK